MKKILVACFALVAGLLFCLAGPVPVLADEWVSGDEETVAADEPKKEYDGVGEMAVGARLTPYLPLRVSVDFLYRPKFGVGGLVLGNSDFSKNFQGTSLAVKTKDLTVLIGYWSNPEKKALLGWHAYLGLGVSLVDIASQKYVAAYSFVNHKKFGLGMDCYVTRMSALTLDASIVSGEIPLKSRTTDADSNNKIYQLKPGTKNFSLQVGYRVWF